jgi:transposase-like protein
VSFNFSFTLIRFNTRRPTCDDCVCNCRSFATKRFYKRKTDEGLVPEQVMRDAAQLVLDGLSIREAATQKAVSKTTLCRYVKKYRSDSSAQLKPNYGHSRVFTVEQETCLENYVSTCSRMFYGLTPKNVRKLAFDIT